MHILELRGAGFVCSQCVRDLGYALRSFRRAPLVALTIVVTVGVGLGLITVVFTILNTFIFRADDVRNPHELFAVERRLSPDAEPDTFSRPQYEALRREAGVFADAFAMTPDIDAWIDGRRMEGALVTGNFFHVLGVSAARGRALTPADDADGSARVMVLSHRAWSQRFANDAAVLNRSLLVNGAEFTIVGVMPEGFRGLTVFAPDFWAPLSNLGEFRRGQRDAAIGLQVIGRLASPRGQALAQLVAWDAQRATGRVFDRRAASLVLEPRPGTVPQPLEAMVLFMPLFFAFGLILLIGCANVANLLLARGVARQREIGVRLAIGASRQRVVSQLLTESLVLAVASAALGLVVSRAALGVVVYVLTSTFPPEFGDIRVAVPAADWRVVVFLLGGAIASTLLFALVPALQATRIELVRAIRGEVVRDARPGRTRDGLIALQVTGSVLLLICSAIFLRSTWAAATVEPGIRTDGIVNVNVLNEDRRAVLLDLVQREPAVVAVAASWPGGFGGGAAMADGASGRSNVTYQFVSPEYFGVLGIEVVKGRGFAPTEQSASHLVAVVAESVARELWPGVDPVGQTVRLEPETTTDAREPSAPSLEPRSAIVIGIARDVAGFRLGGMRMGGAGVYLPIGADAARTSLTIRVQGDAEQARRMLVDRMATIDPNMGELSTLRTLARIESYLLGIPFWLTLVLGLLALLLTLSGLFSVLSYLVEQRSREIGVRKALGATSGSIGALVLSQSARPVGLGLLLGTSLTAGLGGALVASPAAEQIGSSIRLFDPVAYAVSLLIIIAACTGAALMPALRASKIDAAGALRRD